MGETGGKGAPGKRAHAYDVIDGLLELVALS